MSDYTTAPSSNEITAGLAREVGGSRGTVRVDYVYRKFQDMHGSFTDTTTGTVNDATGRSYDRAVVKNSPNVRRRWDHAMTAAADFRLPRVSLGGNYTLSFSKGNNDGENVGS